VPDDALVETLVASELIGRGQYLTFRVETFRDADGGEHRREMVEHPGAIAVLALDADEILLVRQFRGAVREVCLEIPAGTLDRAADDSIEDPDLAAVRELEEETGYRAGRWRALGRFYTAPGFASEEMHLYLATELRLVDAYAGPAEDERLELVRMPWRQAVDLAEAGEIRDAKTLVGLFWLDRLAGRGELGALSPGA
jgi:ADP-ribose pyrophosphatase